MMNISVFANQSTENVMKYLNDHPEVNIDDK
jgi:hypothetical protein